MSSIAHAGLDVHKETIAIALLPAGKTRPLE